MSISRSFTTHFTNRALLSPEERSRLAAMPELGGGNLLATALAVHPDPHIPFIHTDRARLATISEGIGSLDGLQWVQLADDLPAPPPAELPDAWRFKHAAEDPVSIMHSSGTTGIPKAVTQTHASSVAGPRFRLENY